MAPGANKDDTTVVFMKAYYTIIPLSVGFGFSKPFDEPDATPVAQPTPIGFAILAKFHIAVE